MSNEPIDDFGARLKECRELTGISQSELARETGLEPSHINHYESGRRLPSIANLRRLKAALKVPYEMLLGKRDEQ